MCGNGFILMQTGWIQASSQITRQLAWDQTCLPLSLPFPIKSKHYFKVFNRWWHLKSIFRKLPNIQRTNFITDPCCCFRSSCPWGVAGSGHQWDGWLWDPRWDESRAHFHRWDRALRLNQARDHLEPICAGEGRLGVPCEVRWPGIRQCEYTYPLFSLAMGLKLALKGNFLILSLFS